MNIGDIVHLNWTPNAGREMGLPHYGVVVSCKDFNDNIPRIIVAPITSKERKEFGGLRVAVFSTNSKVKGFICLDHIRAIDPQARNLNATGSEIAPQCIHDCKKALQKIFSI